MLKVTFSPDVFHIQPTLSVSSGRSRYTEGGTKLALPPPPPESLQRGDQPPSVHVTIPYSSFLAITDSLSFPAVLLLQSPCHPFLHETFCKWTFLCSTAYLQFFGRVKWWNDNKIAKIVWKQMFDQHLAFFWDGADLGHRCRTALMVLSLPWLNSL